jgi:hypothetical protein
MLSPGHSLSILSSDDNSSKSTLDGVSGSRPHLPSCNSHASADYSSPYSISSSCHLPSSRAHYCDSPSDSSADSPTYSSADSTTYPPTYSHSDSPTQRDLCTSPDYIHPHPHRYYVL